MVSFDRRRNKGELGRFLCIWKVIVLHGMKVLPFVPIERK
jgi:hypothetical protein